MTTSDRIRALHATHPDWTPTQIATHLGDKRLRSLASKIITRGVSAKRGRPLKAPLCPACGGTGRQGT